MEMSLGDRNRKKRHWENQKETRKALVSNTPSREGQKAVFLSRMLPRKRYVFGEQAS